MATLNTSASDKRLTGILRDDLQLFKGAQDEKGKDSWIIFDPVTDRYFRISDASYQIISRFNTPLPIDEFLQKLEQAGISSDLKEVLKADSFLRQNNLFMPEFCISEEKTRQTKAAKKKALPFKILSSYLFFKIPLFKPDNFLNATSDTVKAIFNKWTLILLGLISLWGYINLINKWHRLTADISSSLNFEGLFKFMITVVFLKVLHEFAHAYSAKLQGVRVRRMGISFIVFFPRFYTDLTDSWRISGRTGKIIIDGAGILFELLIGGFAALAWACSTPGMVNTVSYYILAVSIANTVLINGNPLIKYDGYYLLMDLLGIDNLQQRSVMEFKILIRKVFFGIDSSYATPTLGWTKYLLIFYGVSSFIYRIFLYTSIILIVYFKFVKIVGIVLAAIEAYIFLISPLMLETKAIMMLDKKKKKLLISALSLAVLILILIIPLPWRISVPCEVRSAQFGVIYVSHDGFLEGFHVKDGEKIKKGSSVISLYNPLLDMKSEEEKLELSLLKTELDQLRCSQQTLGSSKVKLQQINAKLKLIDEIKRKKALLEIVSPLEGIFVQYDRHLKNDKWLKKGEAVGEVYNPGELVLYAYLKEDELISVKKGRKASVYLNGETCGITGTVLSVNSITESKMELSPLLSTCSGPILVLKKKPEASSYEPAEPYYRVIIALPEDSRVSVGRTGEVKIVTYKSLCFNMLRKSFNILQKELSF